MNSPLINPKSTDISAPFWAGLRERRLMLQVDAASGQAQFYPRPQSLYSEAGVRWQAASGRGSLLTWSLSHVSPPDLKQQVPYVIALVRLQEGPRMMVRVNAPYESLRAGQALEVDWDAPGSTERFPIFKPAA